MHNKPHTEESKIKMSISHKGKPNYSRRRETIEIDGILLYRCSTCKEFKPYGDFYKNKRTILGITSECKKCYIDTSIRTRNKENAREKNRQYAKKARMRNPEKFRERDSRRIRIKDEKYRARMLLNIAVRNGKITKPIKCEECGSDDNIQAHHTDYSKPYDVIWLCSLCHGKKHRKI